MQVFPIHKLPKFEHQFVLCSVRELAVTVEEMRAMSVEALLEVRRQIDQVLSERREELERQLEQITGRTYPLKKSVTRAAKKHATPGNAKVAWRYRSKKDPSLGWSGRGRLPRWMQNEMKGTRLKKQDFLLSA